VQRCQFQHGGESLLCEPDHRTHPAVVRRKRDGRRAATHVRVEATAVRDRRCRGARCCSSRPASSPAPLPAQLHRTARTRSCAEAECVAHSQQQPPDKAALYIACGTTHPASRSLCGLERWYILERATGAGCILASHQPQSSGIESVVFTLSQGMGARRPTSARGFLA
jgi:hypothetical protein